MSIEFNTSKGGNNNISDSQEKEKSSLGIFRGKRKKVLEALAIGSFALFLQACELTREKIDAMPTNTIEDINKNGKELTEKPVIKTEGFVEDLGRKGETKYLPFLSKETTVTHNYILHSSIDPKSPSVGMISTYEGEEGVIDMLTSSFDKIEFPSFDPKHKIEIIGTVILREEGKEAKYVLKISRDGGTFDLTAAAPEKKE